MCTIGILLCAGDSCRMGFHKLVTPLCGRSAVERSMDALLSGGCDALVLAVSDSTRPLVEKLQIPVPYKVVTGGRTRQDSVHIALKCGNEAFPDAEIAVIHDAARCLVAPETVRACIESAREFGSGVAAVHSADTVLMREGTGVHAMDRDTLVVMQTPQVFRYADILSAYETADGTATDDCTLYVRAGFDPQFVPGGRNNFKLTSPEDWAMAEAMLTRCGMGFDTHKLVPGRKLILGGVEIPCEKGLMGHSDADVLTHAIIDALLGAASMGDIGKLFPDSDERFRGADSIGLLTETVRRIRDKGMGPVHVDATIIAEKPKMAPYIEQMRTRLSEALGITREFVSVKATTTEGMNDEGRGLCISAQAVASIR